MIRGLDDLRSGFALEADAVVVGSGAGGATAAANLARAGMRVIVLEAGPVVRPEDMTRDVPRFLARYFWEGGLRMIAGTTQSPSMHARCVGGGTVVNSAIILTLPTWVREIWRDETGIDLFTSPLLDRAYERVLERLRVAPTPMAALGRRNLIVRDAIEGVLGIRGGPLPRAVVDCEGSSDCLTGCVNGRKQSVDRTFLADAIVDGAEVMTCSHVDSIETKGARAIGVRGRIVDPRGLATIAKFSVRAPRVILAAGSMHTPVLLKQSAIDPRRRVGATFFAHIGGGVVGVMDEVVDPWVGATQGWGALHPGIRGIKYEGLWASPSALMVRWGDVGMPFVERLHEVKHATVIAMVYRGDVHGRVGVSFGGEPRASLTIPEHNVRPVMEGLKSAADALLAVGARYVHTGIAGAVMEMRTPEDTASLFSPKITARHLAMTMNHTFGSCRMSTGDDGPVDPEGRVRGVSGLWVCDASVFPSPSAVNPQATIMALSDITSRRIAELPLG